MPHPGEVALHEDRRIAEQPTGERGDLLVLSRHVGRIGDDRHAHAATAGGRLDHDRIADPGGRSPGRLRSAHRVLGPRGDRHAGGGHQVAGGDLVAHRGDCRRARTDPDQPGLHHVAGEIRVLREEAITGMHGGRTGGLGRGQHGRRVPVGLGRVGRPDQHRLVGLQHEREPGVRLRIHGDGAQAHPLRGADHPSGDLSAIGHQQ